MKTLNKSDIILVIEGSLSWDEIGSFSDEEIQNFTSDTKNIRSYAKEELMDEITWEQIENNEVYWPGFEEDLNREVCDRFCEELKGQGYVIED